MIKVSVVIPNYNGAQFLPDCLNSLKKQRFQEFEVILVDNGSEDESISTALHVYPELRLVELKENTGFAYAVNAGIRAAKGEYVILLNNDTIAFPGFVENQYKMIRNKPRVFSCSALMLQNKNRDRVDDAGDGMCALGWSFALGKDKPVSGFGVPHEVFASCGGAAIYRRELLFELGLFDNEFFAYLEDMDIAYRARLAGYKNLYNPHARVYHVGSGSTGSRYNEFKVRLAARNSMYLLRKNMPGWQIALNFPLLYAGVAIKFIFFAKRGFGRVYLDGIAEGLMPKAPIRKTGRTKDRKACIRMERELLWGLGLWLKNRLGGKDQKNSCSF